MATAFSHPPLPSVLQYFATSIGVSRNRCKVFSNSRVVARPGDIIEMSMPPQMVDRRSVTLSMRAKCTTGAADSYCKLSANSQSVLDGISETSEGFTINTGLVQGWNRWANLLEDLTQVKQSDAACVLYENIPSNPETAANDGEYDDMIIHIKDFPGTFIGSCEPRVQDFKLFPLKVSFRLAPANHAWISKTTANLANITYEDACLTFDVLQLADSGAYEHSVQDKINSGGLNIPFTSWRVFSSGARPVEDSLNFTMNSTSVKGLLGIFTPASVNTNPEQEDTTTYKNNWLRNGIGATNTLTSSYFQVGTTNFPAQGPSPVHEVFDQTIRNLPKERKSLSFFIDSEASYLSCGGAAHYVRFGMPEDEDTIKLRLRDGINCFGQAITTTWHTSGNTGGAQPTKHVLVETQPVLVVHPGRLLEVVP